MKSLILIFISFLLMACGDSDSPQQSVQSEWGISEPVIKSHSGKTYKFTDVDLYNKLVEIDILHFDYDSEQVDLTITSVCGSKEYKQSNVNIKSIMIHKLIPKSIYLKMINSKSKLICDIQFIAENLNGDIHEFYLLDLNFNWLNQVSAKYYATLFDSSNIGF